MLIYLLCLIGLAFFVWTAVHLVLTRRIRAIVSAAEHFAAGDLSARTDMAGTDEIGRLGRVFDDMATKLQSSLQSLDLEIQERKVVETTLRENERKTRAMLDQTFQFIGLMTTDGALIEVNRTALEFAGISASDVLNKPFWKTPWWKHSEELQDVLRSAVKKAALGDFIRFEATHPAADGTLHYVDFSIKPVPDDTGAVSFLIPEGRDISDRKKVEERLRKEAERGDLLLELYDKAPLLTDKQLYDYALEQAIRLTDSTIGFLHLISDDQESVILTTWNNEALKSCTASSDTHYPLNEAGCWVDCVRLGRPVIYNDFDAYPNRKGLPEGHSPVLRFMSIPVMEDGKVKIIFGVGNKVDEYDDHDVVHIQLVANELQKIIRQHHAEEELKNHRDHLEKLVKARTVELAEAKERAEAANLAKSRFLASVSHELRTPLNSILGYSQLMQRDPALQPRQREYLSTISRSGEHLLELINDVLEITRIEAMPVMLAPHTFDLHAMLGDLHTMFKVRTEARCLSFELSEIRALPRYVVADETKVRQVLINLLGNAVKFTHKGGITVRVAAKSKAPDGMRLVVEVEDTGEGIAEEELDSVFRCFEQTAAGRKNQGGTGLGMAISRNYARMMGGDITVTSREGEGSTFRFEIEVQEGRQSDFREKAREYRVIGLAPGRPAPRILVAEGREENRTLLVRLFEQVGFQVREAEDGEKAVELFERWAPHFIWMDVSLPVIDGLEATRRIKATERGGSVKIAALTASAMEEDRGSILAAGCDDFVLKPYRELEIFQVMGRHLCVKYLYEEEAEESAAGPKTKLSAGRLAVLPSDLRDELYKMALELDMNGVLEVVEKIARHDAHLGTILKDLADNYRYSHLLALLEGDDTDMAEGA